ncbi:MAG TPA: ABC transporter substrate-binding protein [Cycloclasticus sp.]|jgi:iron complex transport system substrate-binding protein|nr:ABC transporter substrate-binding protein [Cycloclasticus sp.]HIL92678.1 ABC transporter substrate-binding protein [Cycloclasticus sp.]
MNLKQTMELICCVAVLLFSISNVASSPRIVSLNLCADQLLIEMLPPERLVGITNLASDSGISFQHERALQYHQHNGRVEEIIALKPDLIVAGAFTSQTANHLLEKLGYSVIQIGLPKTLVEIEAQVMKLGHEVGAVEQAVAMVRTMSDSLDLLRTTRVSGSPKAAIYYANGFSAGKQTIVDEVLIMAGFRNIAAEKGLDYVAPLSMEALLKAEPDVLILGRYQENTNSMAHQVLQHPALQAYIQSSQAITISMPDSYWDCAGPSIVAAVERLQMGHQKSLSGNSPDE